MNNLRNLFLGGLVTIVGLMFYSCSQDMRDADELYQNVENHTCKMIFNVTRVGFDDEPTTRSVAEWENGDTIYLLFTSGTDLVYGDAVYKDGEWFVNYNGKLVSDQETSCKAYYFEDKVSATHSTVALNENSAIYEDNDGKYTLTDGSLSVTATLKPKTGRLRFKGIINDEVKIYGITRNTSFNRYTGEYTTSKTIIKAKVGDEYTPYIYGSFTDTIEPRINVWKITEGFTRYLPTTIYKPGESGFMTIPTADAHNGWQNNVIFKVEGVEFTMIPVKSQYSIYENFLLAQTETTEELYKAVMKDGTSSKLPKNNISYGSWNSFITEINNLTQLTFAVPLRDNWDYAYKGGSKSQDFTYSGSNNIDEVAWYSGNSNATRHEVATKQPNELGFYDMSGNVSEYVSSNAFYGGNYKSTASGCNTTSSIGTSSSSTLYGLRLYLSNK